MWRHAALLLWVLLPLWAGRRVQKVVDGDTFILEDGERVRLLGIDALELGQPGADIVKAYLESLVLGKEVELETDSVKRDRYGRLLAHVWVDTIYVNGRMVRKGYVTTRFFPPNYKHKDELIALQEQAEKGKRGLWALGVFQPSGLSVTPASGTAPPPPDLISWEEAPDHIGEIRTVEGVIVSSYNSGKVCFLNFHPDYRRHLTAVIFASDFDKFPTEPEEYYLHRKVRIRGLIKEYRGKPEIILESPDQIQILE